MTDTRKVFRMTYKEFLQAIIEGNLSEDVQAKAQTELEKMELANERRRNSPTKAQIENAPLADAMHEILTDEPLLTTDLAAAMDLSTSKASAIARLLEKEGRAVSHDIIVPKVGLRKGYTRG